MPTLIPKDTRAAVLHRYRNDRQPEGVELSYATVRDFCDSADHLPGLMYFNSDLKDVQRPWALKAIVSRLPPGSVLAEIGGGVPMTAAALVELGYKVTIVDPYEGAGNGPVEYEFYREEFRGVQFVRELFLPQTSGLVVGGLDCVFSISTLEHILEPGLTEVFKGVDRFLRPGGWSIHCVDSITEGHMEGMHRTLSEQFLAHQCVLAGLEPDSNQYSQLVDKLTRDLETYYLGPQGFHQWRFDQTYDEYPFRRVVSIQSCVQKRAV